MEELGGLLFYAGIFILLCWLFTINLLLGMAAACIVVGVVIGNR
jgi:hypothetical protein